jgi:hypothetical protein
MAVMPFKHAESLGFRTIFGSQCANVKYLKLCSETYNAKF